MNHSPSKRDRSKQKEKVSDVVQLWEENIRAVGRRTKLSIDKLQHH